jgi:hypothetical protein
MGSKKKVGKNRQDKFYQLAKQQVRSPTLSAALFLHITLSTQFVC